jgi:hypothetical protein
MIRVTAMLLVALWTFVGEAQTRVDPTGHWEGTIQAPGLALDIEVDLIRTATGELAGTITIPAENTRGLPLKVAVDGDVVRFHARADQPIAAVLSPDGTSLSAHFNIDVYSIPFTLVRTGEPRFDVSARSAAVGRELEGTWTGVLRTAGGEWRLALTLANGPEGSSTGIIVNLDQGGLEIPASAIEQAAATLTLEFKAVGASFKGTLNAEGTELLGTFSQGAVSVPVTFRHTATGDQR